MDVNWRTSTKNNWRKSVDINANGKWATMVCIACCVSVKCACASCFCAAKIVQCQRQQTNVLWNDVKFESWIENICRINGKVMITFGNFSWNGKISMKKSQSLFLHEINQFRLSANSNSLLVIFFYLFICSTTGGMLSQNDTNTNAFWKNGHCGV